MAKSRSGRNSRIWLWILGWVLVFPIPLAILLFRKKNMKAAVKIGIIAVATVVYLGIVLSAQSSSGGSGTRTATDTSVDTETTSNVIKDISFSKNSDIALTVGEKFSSDYIEIKVDNPIGFSPNDIKVESEDSNIASISITDTKQSTKLGYEIKAVGIGETTVFAKSIDGTVISNPIRVIVSEPIKVESISIKEVDDDIMLGRSVLLSIEVKPENADKKTVSWSSSDSSIIRVDQNGIAYGISGGTATITAFTSEGVSSSIELTVDGSKRVMNVKTSHLRHDDENIGDEWSFYQEINGESPDKQYTISVGDTLSFYARFTEQDEKPDVGEAWASYTVSDDDLVNGFTVSLDLYVTENAGRNSGKSAYFTVDYVFTPQ